MGARVTGRTTVIGALAVVGALVAPAAAEPPSPGKWVVAEAAWVFPTGAHTGRLIEVDVTQHTSVTGEVTTDASAWRGHCKRDADHITCMGGGGPRLVETALTYDATVSTATLKMVTRSGQVFRTSWQASEPVPDGSRSDSSSCSSTDGQTGSSVGYAVLRPATASAHVFRTALGSEHLIDANLGVGVGTRPCTTSLRSTRYS